ncbi:Uncharacterized protein RNJ44_03556 [Nakaseomyces bracarensis]|uniref:Peptidase S8/S53 domain-containing protein n=1 Tax=Nakaseomyces bracarensis TaxID=273131 RepID=A0ABR4NX93_9SACH
MLIVIYFLVYLAFVNAEEYIVSLKGPKSFKKFMDSAIVQEILDSRPIKKRIKKTYSFGNFRGIVIDLPSEWLFKIKKSPFVSEVVPNFSFKAFDDELLLNEIYKSDVLIDEHRSRSAPLPPSNITLPHDDDTSIYDGDGIVICKGQNTFGPPENDDDQLPVVNGKLLSRYVKTQHQAPRHLARLSRRSQLPYDFNDPTRYDGEFNYYYYGWYQGRSVTVYVLDSGIMTDHCDFEGRATHGADFVQSGQPGDENGHGTHVAGVIGSRTFGVAKQVNLVDVKVLDNMGSGTLDTVMSGLEYVAHNCKKKKKVSKCVINLSLGTFRSNIINEAIEEIVAQGIVVVVAAGNANMNACWTSPASAPDVVTVGAFDDRIDSIAKFSNWGNCVDIFAPGVLVNSLSNRYPYTPIAQTGTSMATPSITGLVALLLDSGTCTATTAKQRLLDLATQNIFPRRTLMFKPGTPNKVAFNGIKRDDDLYTTHSYPNITIDYIIRDLESYQPANRVDKFA